MARKKPTTKKAGSRKTARKTTGKATAGTSTAGKTTARKTSRSTSGRSPAGRRSVDASGKHLVIVESPAKAKTINRYLGGDYVVQASLGSVRDLPAKAAKGSRQPVPGVDLENDFEPTYEVLPDRRNVVTDLKRCARQARDIWFATDLDREGEAIAWHLAQELGVNVRDAKRVVFNAITKDEIARAFARPHEIDEAKVNAQQARRILDRIVGYQVSPLLWRKVAGGLSAGRVQSVAVRMVVDREREIRSFVPDEYWRVTACMTLHPDQAGPLAPAWRRFIETGGLEPGSKPDGTPTRETGGRTRGRTSAKKNVKPSVKDQNAWLTGHDAVRAELVELGGAKFDLRTGALESRDLSDDVRGVADAVGLRAVRLIATDDPEGKGPARTRRTVEGEIDPAARYRVRSVETKRTTSRPLPPFITSTLQMSASGALGFGPQRTMRLAQSLYEGVNVPGEGTVGLITYMRTDSTHVSSEALGQARRHIGEAYGDAYLPKRANVYASSNQSAQEAHEAIRPTDVNRHPHQVASSLAPDQARLYRLIWQRFVASQMTPAQWDATSVLLERSDRATGALFRASGRRLEFDGFYRVSGVPKSGEEQTLPGGLAQGEEGHELAPFAIDPEQQFTSPPPRYSEASLIKALESEGIGRPSTYASILQTIQDRQYVEQVERRLHATDLGEVVTDKLVEGFPELMELGYTRRLEEDLDRIESQRADWKGMLRDFYGPFAKALDAAHDTLGHAKAASEPAPHRCPECGSGTVYRFGKRGRFLSCSAYPTCRYAAPIDREGRPVALERVNVACPVDGSPMVLRSGKYGQFLTSASRDVECVISVDRQGRIKRPAPPPFVTDLACPTCKAKLNLRRGQRGPWLSCSAFPKCRGKLAWTKVEPARQKELLEQLADHEKQHPKVALRTLDGKLISEGTKVAELMVEVPAREARPPGSS